MKVITDYCLMEQENFHNTELKKIEIANSTHQAQQALATRLTGVMIRYISFSLTIFPDQLVLFYYLLPAFFVLL